jgi:hypothetical protein
LEVTDESFEYKNHMDTSSKRFSNITSKIYSRFHQKNSFDPEQITIDTQFQLPKLKAKAKRIEMTREEPFNSIKNFKPGHSWSMIMDSESNLSMDYQPLQKHQHNLKTYVKEFDGSHREKFDSMFEAEIIKNNAAIASKSVLEKFGDAKSLPNLMLKRKASWSGMVGNRLSEAAAAIRATPTQDMTVIHDSGLQQQQARLKHTETPIVIRFQRQRYHFFLDNSIFCSENSSSIRAENEASKQLSEGRAEELTQQACPAIHCN